MKSIQEQLGDATKPYLSQVESQPGFVGTRLDMNNDQYSIMVLVENIESATRNGIQNLVQSPINVVLEDGTPVSVSVDFEESEEFILDN